MKHDTIKKLKETLIKHNYSQNQQLYSNLNYLNTTHSLNKNKNFA